MLLAVGMGRCGIFFVHSVLKLEVKGRAPIAAQTIFFGHRLAFSSAPRRLRITDPFGSSVAVFQGGACLPSLSVGRTCPSIFRTAAAKSFGELMTKTVPRSSFVKRSIASGKCAPSSENSK